MPSREDDESSCRHEVHNGDDDVAGGDKQQSSVEEHGRTYNAQGKYFLPNDSTEQSRLDLQHEAWKLAMDRNLAWAPVDRGSQLANVLDVGTGTGAWAVEFAERHPEAQVFGTDLSLIQPTYVPPNCQFVNEDSEQEWAFRFPFDYIHLRMMAVCFSDHKRMARRLFDHLRPGGWIEYQEFSLEATSSDAHTQHVLRADPASFQGLLDRLKDGFWVLGKNIDVTPGLKGMLSKAGFVDVVEKRISVPITPWSSDPREEEVGRLLQRNWHDAIESAIKALYATSMSPEETRAYIEACQDNLKDPDLKIYHTWWVLVLLLLGFVIMTKMG